MESAEALKPVTKIHLLVHPGFFINEKRRDETETGTAERVIQYQAEESAKLLKRIEDYADTVVKENAVMIALIDGTQNDFRSGEIPYTHTIRAISEKLGKRLVVLADDKFKSLSTQSNKKIFENMRRLFAARGFTFDTSTPIEAYGETSGMCVKAALDALYATGGFSGPVEMNRSLTDESFGSQA